MSRGEHHFSPRSQTQARGTSSFASHLTHTVTVNRSTMNLVIGGRSVGTRATEKIPNDIFKEK